MIRLLVVGFFLAVISYWLHRRLVRATGLGRRTAVAVDIVLAVLVVLVLAASASGTIVDPAWARPFGFLGWTWLAAGLYLVLGLLLIAFAGFVGRRIVGVSDDKIRRGTRIATGLVVLAVIGVTGYGVVEASQPRIVHTTVALEGLPEGFSGLRVALVTDLHVGPARGVDLTRKVVDEVRAQHPDLVILGGDLADGTVAYVGDDLAPLAELAQPLGVFGVTGNHEYYSDDAMAWLDHWETLGVRTLRNEHVVLERNGDSIVLAGVHDYTAPGEYAPDLPAALDGVQPEEFVLLAAHQPKHVLEAQDAAVDLQVSGHTHGGQMWPLGYIVAAANPTVTGLDRFEDTTIYTSAGAGTWGPPVRVATPPEISILELVSAG